MNGSKIVLALVIAALAMAGSACSKKGGSSMSVSAKSAAQIPPTGGSLDLGGGVLVKRVRIAVVKVALEAAQSGSEGTTGTSGTTGPSGTSGPPMAAAQGSGGADTTGGADEGESGEVRVGPCLIDLTGDKLTATSNSLAPVCATDVPDGTYDELEVRVGPVAAADAGGVAGLADMDGSSVIVDGTVNGTDFSFHSTLDAELQIETTITVSSSVSNNVTISVDPTGWFKGPAGPLDPTASRDLKTIEANIAASIQSFEDDNKDGIDDGKEPAGGGKAGGG
jgi:hypothetical protein